ncbi:hypothetical protein [Comamonas sp. NoAH]|uniref:hypothetical protein n=1 Tax=Comamonas halotolerans TaxID=3041496 RepID=UPI0024E07CDF|nr:hypothetical protein [Comamonas sp. NoAH]
MTTKSHTPLVVPVTDPDLIEQAKPGHGVPSQDPDPRAQVGLTPNESARGMSSSLVGGGAMAGAAVGAAVGGVVGGSVGVLVGGSVGGVAAALGVAIASTSPPDEESEAEDRPVDE